MRLESLTLALAQTPELRAVADAAARQEPLLVGLIDSAKPVTVAALVLDPARPIILIAPTAAAATRYVEELPAWLGPEVPVLPFPETGVLPFERQPVPPSVSRDRLRALAALHNNERVVIVASMRSAASRTIAPERLITIAIERGRPYPQETMLRQFQALGYAFAPLADRPGTVARRGGIVDVFPPAAAPVRVEWLGDDIDSLREYDAMTQRSGRTLEWAWFGPADETAGVFDAAAIANVRAGIDCAGMAEGARARYEDELARLGEGEVFDPFYAHYALRSTLLDHLPPTALLLLDEPADGNAALQEAAERAEAERADLEGGGELPRGLPLPFLRPAELSPLMEARPAIRLGRWIMGEEAGSVRLGFVAAPAFGGRWRSLAIEAAGLAGRGGAVAIVSQQAARLRELLTDVGVDPAGEGDAPAPRRVIVVAGTLTGGWALPAVVADGALTVLTDAEVFGFLKQRRPLPWREEGASSALLSELEPGEFVVHIEHGIGRFAGVVRRPVDGAERDYLELHYAERDRLFVPSDQIDRVTRYIGPGDHTPVLTRLGSGDWARAKDRVRRAVADLAEELIRLHATRQLIPGHAFSPDTPWQQELEASFPFIETPDQMEAIRATKAEMEQQRPMDRLICGDVGYGKTEVAVRAAFKAVMDGMQVAILVPTTVLAQQHLATFAHRLAGFPMRVEMLSRFRSDRDQREVVARLAEGSVDIVIGTHRLLQKDVRFNNVGLVIIDEEQRFGVAHKERLKQMRHEVDVLTLTATPIPRTLHMALAGIRDMSTIQTPPEARQPIRTYVAEYDERLVREAITREVARGGQVYFVHNRVHSIDYIAAQLRRAIPEATFVIGHGQMPEDQLEHVMIQFAEGQADVLVCTTIIESGLDIPNVNTIIIHQADKFGLAQIYQLRGRVGRSAARAYAYLLYEKGRALTEVAQRRLQAIFEATELGAGFQIAMRDLEIRGAGNLLGAEQSGHIGAVGFELYTRMLAEAVERLKALREGRPAPRPLPATEVSFDLPLAAYLPETYVAELAVRLALYQRLAEVRSPDDAAELARELRDRFGPLPPPARQILYVAGLRAAAQMAGVTAIGREDGTLVVKMGRRAVDALTPGRRMALERSTPRGLRVGPTQVRLDLRALGESWQQVLLDVVGALSPEPAGASRA